MSEKIYKLDGKKFESKAKLYEYIEVTYKDDLERTQWSAAHYYFFRKYGKANGTCVISGKPTTFNEDTERFNRFYSEVEADIYRERFKQNMQKKYGAVHLLNSPEQQKIMLDNRSISSDYVWNDKTKTKVTSTYEMHFLDYCENVLKLKSTTFTKPPTIYYKDNGTDRFYLPDFYIPSLNLIIEIKGSNNHYQKRDEYKEDLKRLAVEREKFDFIQVNDKDYTKFNLYFTEHVIDN